MAEIAGHLGRLAGRPDLLRIGALPARVGDPPAMLADLGRLRLEVGFPPGLSLADGLAASLAALRAASGGG